jgi:arylsulfatase A-like enzyme
MIALLVASSSGAPARTPDNRPNVLIILTDDQRFDMIRRKVMPETRRIFDDEGVRFDNAVATTPLCCPSRASIFSGRYEHNHGVDSNKPDFTAWDASQTIQHELHDDGYQTAIAGKFFSSWSDNPPDFDQWAIHIRPRSEPLTDYYGATFNINGALKKIPRHSTNVMRSKALKFLDHFETRDDDPWLMQISPLSPHRPATPLKKHRGAEVPAWKPPPSIGEDLRDKPEYVREAEPSITTSQGVKRHRRMLRSLKGVDELVRDVFAWLEANGEEENTLAFFLSDNGLHLGEHGLSKKDVPYEEAVRVPFFMRWPAQVTPGRDAAITANVDIAATIYDATGIQPSYAVDGRSLLSGKERGEVLIESGDGSASVPPWRGLWSSTYVYVRYATGEREYYDIANDPYQLRNLLQNANQNDDPDTSELDARLDAAASCVGRSCP